MKPIAVSTGDPGGVGPVVSVRACARLRQEDRLVLFGDAARLEGLLFAEGVPGDAVVRLEGHGTPLDVIREGSVGLAHVADWSSAARSHAPTAEGGRAQLAALETAARAVRDGRCRALVTAPVSKEAITFGGTPFVGQTEYLARLSGRGDDEVTMMFLGPKLVVALVTTHLAVRDVPAAVTEARVARSICHLSEALRRCTQAPRIVVTGLNPHAGEGGLFGTEERSVVEPAVARVSDELGTGAVVVGPRPAEWAFREAAAGVWDGVVAMMHDQATIASKLLDFGRAVNVTWGLPFVRTSPDHGVAYDAAQRGAADSVGMHAAIDMARELTRSRAPGERA